MKTLRFTAYLFYRYYSTGATKDIPYFSTLCALVMLFSLHVFQFFVLFDMANLMPTKNENTRVENLIIIALCLTPVFLLMSFLIKKSDLRSMKYDEGGIKKGNILLILYIIASILLIPLIVFIKKGHL